MSDAKERVLTFLAGFGRSPTDDIANMKRYMADEVEWHTGTAAIGSLADAVTHMENAQVNYGVSSFRARNCHVAADGPRVFVERWDDVFDADGALIVSLALASFFEVEDGKIAVWRDYYNPDVLRDALAARAAS